MDQLFKAAASVKDPFTVFAFVVAVLLVAFTIKGIREGAYRLVEKKITRERFSQLLNRSLLYGFLAFLALCVIAISGQFFGYMTAARAASVDELKQELALRRVDDSTARQAMEDYQRGLAQDQDHKLDDAIASLQASLRAVPTTAAQETIALLYKKAGKSEQAVQAANQAVDTARAGGDPTRIAKAQSVLKAVSPQIQLDSHCPANAGLIGAKLPLPPGGNTFETATSLVPCVYQGVLDSAGEQWKVYKVSVPGGKTIKVVMRTRENGADGIYFRLHGPDGGVIDSPVYEYRESVVTAARQYTATTPAVVFLSMKGGIRDSAFDLSIQ